MDYHGWLSLSMRVNVPIRALTLCGRRVGLGELAIHGKQVTCAACLHWYAEVWPRLLAGLDGRQVRLRRVAVQRARARRNKRRRRQRSVFHCLKHGLHIRSYFYGGSLARTAAAHTKGWHS